MKEELLAWWAEQEKELGQRLKKPTDLLNRSLSNSEYVDSAVIGGIELKDIVAGKIAESQIPPDVVKAFHEQYPNVHVGFVSEVHRLGDHPAQLRGLINGVKGKLLEDQYLEWLNHGHLPVGLHAELAHTANNPAWDIVIKDSHGHVDKLLQLKATESADYVHHALDLHPQIDVVTTHEVFSKLADHHSDLAHLIDSGITNTSLTDHAGHAADYADSAGHLAFHIPEIAIGIAIALELRRYLTGRQSMMEAIQNMTRRSLLACVATGAGWIAASATGNTIVGLPVAVLTRIGTGRMADHFELRYFLNDTTSRIKQSAARLATAQ